LNYYNFWIAVIDTSFQCMPVIVSIW